MTECSICWNNVAHEDQRIAFDPYEMEILVLCPDCFQKDLGILKMVAINDDRFPGHAVYVYIDKD